MRGSSFVWFWHWNSKISKMIQAADTSLESRVLHTVHRLTVTIRMTTCAPLRGARSETHSMVVRCDDLVSSFSSASGSCLTNHWLSNKKERSGKMFRRDRNYLFIANTGSIHELLNPRTFEVYPTGSNRPFYCISGSGEKEITKKRSPKRGHNQTRTVICPFLYLINLGCV
jgi:hypothetical protein